MPNLIGTGNNQVPTNGMLGGLAYQSPDNAVIKNLELTNLSGHNSVIPSNAVDVFVYDTRKDSDGGAWRKRTQHTSWYNETLNTATRGSRRDFPAVAVIVIDGTFPNKVTIYDGDDPDLPMWMVFETGRTTTLRALNWWTSGNGLSGVNSVVALNGILVISPGNGTVHFDFIKDSTRISYGPVGSDKYQMFPGTILTRNNYTALTTNGDGYVLAQSTVNDIAMTVLPNAPIDPSTGLPIPTIAVATNGGVSVIRDDGSVVNWLTNVGYIQQISISKNYELFAGGGATVAYYAWYNKTIPTSSTNTYDAVFGATYSSTSLPRLGNNGNSNVGDKNVFSNDTIYFAEYAGVSTNDKLILLNQNTSAFGNSLVSYVTRSYNTGWMHGDIKGAWLSDTSTASVTGTELNQYGDFASTTGWGSRSAAWTISGGVASVSSGAGYQLLGLTSGTLTNGRKYAVTVNVTAFTAGRLELSQANSSNIQFNLGSTGAKTLIFTYTGTTGQALGIYGYGDASYSFTIDNLYVRELSEADRSVNNTGLAVYGTITKTAVATGADLVEYSGWSKSNYLLRPGEITDLNNSSMTFMTWYKCSSISEEEALISTGDYNTISEVRALYIAPSGIAGFSGWGNDFNPGSRSVRDDIWHHLAVTLQYISGNSYFVSVYVDGVLTGTSERTLLTFSNTAIDIGGGTLPLNRFARGSLALCRISTSVVSANQMLKIYNDEKALFQENSKSTLYGSSDAVTALAYDDTTKLLHVGTSSGRSDFQGLERINNTTTAVTTAISASNGLIAEQ